MSDALDRVYRERNAIACALALAVISAGGQAGVTTDPEGEDWFRVVVVVQLPTGRVGWHMDERDPAKPWVGLPEYPEPWEAFSGEENAERLRDYLEGNLGSVAARAARRQALAHRLQAAGIQPRHEPSFWPAAESWSDEQVVQVERWLTDTTDRLPVPRVLYAELGAAEDDA